jgi:ADP-heptose:LPS heptosyltransferase
MHLANASGIRTIGIFSNKNLPGIWYPYNNYQNVVQAKPSKGIESVSVDDVLAKVAQKS